MVNDTGPPVFVEMCARREATRAHDLKGCGLSFSSRRESRKNNEVKESRGNVRAGCRARVNRVSECRNGKIQLLFMIDSM